MARTKSTARRDRATEHRRRRMNEALAYRKQGLTYREIASIMRISVDTAHKYVADSLREITRENAEQVLALELDRYDQLLNAAYEDALDGNLLAMDRVITIMSRIERLHGVESPKAQDDTAETAGMLQQILAAGLKRLETSE